MKKVLILLLLFGCGQRREGGGPMVIWDQVTQDGSGEVLPIGIDVTYVVGYGRTSKEDQDFDGYEHEVDAGNLTSYGPIFDVYGPADWFFSVRAKSEVGNSEFAVEVVEYVE